MIESPKTRRAAHGTPEWLPAANGGGRYVARVSVPGEKRRPRIPLVHPTTKKPLIDKDGDRALAAELSAAMSQWVRSEVFTQEAPRDQKFNQLVHELGHRWTSGKLFQEYGRVCGLRTKITAKDDAYRLSAYVYPFIGEMRVVDVLENHVMECLRDAAKKAEVRNGAPWRAASQFHVWQVMHRLFDLAIAPCRLRTDNPVSDNLKPEKDADKLFSYLFPEELLQLLACTEVPLQRRIYYASGTYTGLRAAALKRFTWSCVDFRNRMILSMINKNGGAQYFPMSTPKLPGYASILNVWSAWYQYRGRPSRIAPIIDDLECRERRVATALRNDLVTAGITREVLFMDTATVEPLRFHDLRATFLTWARQAEMPDWWIAERTGHRSDEQMDRYFRGARVLDQLIRSNPEEADHYLPFPDLAQAVPELRNIEPEFVVTAGGLLVPNDAQSRVWQPASV